jgi:filamentous hemagglutinin
LYAEGARLAKELKLPIGAHLSAEQAAALTSNVVILETREVTTPSGQQQVLVPIVYLAHVQPGDLQANGPLIAAKDIGLYDSKGFSNQGALIAKNSLTVTMARDATLNNTGGTLQAGGLLQLGTTNTDIDLTSARVKAGDLTLVSGKDLILNTASKERTTVSSVSTRTQTDLGRTASIEVSKNANLTTAGDFTQNAGQISVGGNLNANVGGSYNLGTVAQTDHQTADYKRSRGTAVKTDITRTTQQTSSIQVGGDATIIAGQDINTKGAQITSDGNLALKAGRDVNLGTAENSLKSDMAFQHSQSGLLSSSKTKLHEQSNQTSNVGTTLSGNVSTVVAGHDINVTGSNVVSTAGTSLAAQNDIKIGAASDKRLQP